MSRDGWRVGPLATDDIEHIDIKGRDPRITKYKHSDYPTLIIVDQAGKELSRKTGAIDAAKLAEWIRSTRTHAAPPAIPVQDVSATGWRGSKQPFARRSSRRTRRRHFRNPYSGTLTERWER
jgi:hypothetical protein